MKAIPKTSIIATPLSVEKISEEFCLPWMRLAEELAPIFQKFGLTGSTTVLHPDKNVLDNTAKVLMRNGREWPKAVLICSTPIAPDIVARGVEMADRAKTMLGPKLGRVILPPMAVGNIDGLSYMLLPWRQPFSDSRFNWIIQRTLVRSRLMKWLREVTQTTARIANSVDEAFAAALDFVISHPHIAASIQQAAYQAAQRLRTGKWAPRFVLAHNDLWKGNILVAPSAFFFNAALGQFTIIDWLGANTAGYPIYDLIRLADAMKINQRTLSKELNLYADILGCDRQDIKGYLAAALGNIGMNLEHFPEELFLAKAKSCWNTLSSVGE